MGLRISMDAVEKKYVLLLPRTEPRFLGRPARSLVHTPSEFPRLPYLITSRMYFEPWVNDKGITSVEWDL
jgi:hypothetical protein